jgi:flagellar protein FliS
VARPSTGAASGGAKKALKIIFFRAEKYKGDSGISVRGSMRPKVQEGTVAYTNGLTAYKETRIKTASQGQLIIMLYDEAVRQLDQGVELLKLNAGEKKDPGRIEPINKAILKTQEIITELMVSLDFEQGGEISQNLFSLYTWFNQELLEGNISQDHRKVQTVRNMMDELRGAWNEAISRTQADALARPAEGINIAG